MESLPHDNSIEALWRPENRTGILKFASLRQGSLEPRNTMRIVILVLSFLFVIAPAQAADCNAPAAAGVDWQRCYMDGRGFIDSTLSGSRLRETSFQRSDLSGADLRRVDGYRARFVSTRMRGTKLDDGQFSDADFTKADLAGASLARADLRRARFFHASLRGADLTGAKTQGAEMLGADLSGALWTDGVRRCAEGSIGQCN
ncbi:Uncharacterized low-complexity protein [Magnetospirillum molischianum DSM 120]|uniref:Uncharacterized low-complexity protein n=2 Tax=Magnetospirillum molischianum TaxID=1083 RepID=H8FQJ3_MAGML|nr:Uncharacterized low-complexity protein [Magnetospirillum molischianum DSM 120]